MLLLSDYQHRHALELLLETLAPSCSGVTCFDEIRQVHTAHIECNGDSCIYDTVSPTTMIMSVPFSVLNRVLIITAALLASSALSMKCGSKLI